MADKAVFGLLVLATAATSALAADWVRRHAVLMGLMHEPNLRSSHVQLTPHGGGIGIVLGGTLAGLVLILLDSKDSPIWLVLWMSLVIAAVGLWDDLRHVSARWRLLAQFLVCAITSVGWGMVDDPAGLGTAALFLFILAAMWWINLFNFMDGIDGLAGMQAVFMFLAGVFLMLSFSSAALEISTWRWMVLLAVASAGFLWLNWPPAKIFMGDVGSTYLGFLLFFLGYSTLRDGWMTSPTWIILGALFVCDATLTLLVRMLRGERWFEAHRSHVYQLLAHRWHSHRKVTILALVINLCVLLPAAWMAMSYPTWAWTVVGIVYTFLILLLIMVRARCLAQQG